MTEQVEDPPVAEVKEEVPEEVEETKEVEDEPKDLKFDNLDAAFILNLEEVFQTFQEGEGEEKIAMGSLLKVLQWIGFNPTDGEITEYS